MPALRDISFTIREGEFIALVGPSGCGKSTLLRVLTGLVPATGGEVLYEGKVQKSVNLDSAMVFQSFLPIAHSYKVNTICVIIHI